MSVSAPPVQVSKLRIPPKPPRPTLPSHLTPAPGQTAGTPASSQSQASDEHSETDTHRAKAKDHLLGVSCKLSQDPSNVVSEHRGTEAVPSEPCLISLDLLLEPTKPLVLSDSLANCLAKEETRHPVPRPRSKQPVTKEVKVQTLVRLKDDRENAQLIPKSGEVFTSKYLQELLEIFAPEDQCLSGISGEQSDQGEDMSALRAKIQAFEKQTTTGCEDTAVKKPEPRPRIQQPKPPTVAPKPSFTPKPPNKKAWEGSLVPTSSAGTDDGKASSHSSGVKPPVATVSVSETKLKDVPVPQSDWRPSQPHIAPRARSLMAQCKGGVTDSQVIPDKVIPTEDLINLDIPSRSSQSAQSSSDNKDTGDAHNDVLKHDSNRPALPRKPALTQIPSKAGPLSEGESADAPPPLPVERPVSRPPHPVFQKPSTTCRAAAMPRAPECSKSELIGRSLSERSGPPRPSGGKVPPPRPPPAKGLPGRPPPPKPGFCRSSSDAGPKQKKGPALPPRPSPGPPLHSRQGIGKEEVLIHFEQNHGTSAESKSVDPKSKEPSPVKNLVSPAACSMPGLQVPELVQVPKASPGLQVEVLHDFSPAGPGELALKVGDLVSRVEPVDNDWYRGTCGGVSGIFPVNHVKVMPCVSAPSSGNAARLTAATVSGPRCVARFSFEGKHSDELSLCQGDVVKLRKYVDQEWAHGELDGRVGIFPLSFVEIVEDLPATAVQQGGQSKTGHCDASPVLRDKDVTEPSEPQAGPAKEEWAVALYSFAAQTDEDLSFQQGQQILIIRHVDSDWCCGRLDDKEGLFPKAFVQIRTGEKCGM